MAHTPDQAKAIDAADGHNVICSLPGSGKTYTMVASAQELLSLPNTRLLLITFTNAAKDEMAERLLPRLTAAEKRRVTITTFDSHFLQLLRRANVKIGRLLVGTDQWQYLFRAANTLSLEVGKHAWQEAFLDVESIGRHQDPSECQDMQYYELYQAYVEQKRVHGAMDLGDVARKVIEMTTLGQLKCDGTSHILVDEFQDVSDVQLFWLLHQGRLGKKINVYGDDDQSIYGWRGSCGYEAMMHLQRNFNAEGHLLGTCFRCKEEILAAAGEVIGHNNRRIPKVLKSGAGRGGEVKVVAHEDREQQNGTIAEMLLQHFWHDGEISLDPEVVGTTAILARTNNQLELCHEQLLRAGFPPLLQARDGFLDDPVINQCLRVVHTICRQGKSPFLGDALAALGEADQTIAAMVQRARAAHWHIGTERGLSDAVHQLVGLSMEWRGECGKGGINGRLEQLSALLASSQDRQLIRAGKALTTVIKRREGNWWDRWAGMLETLEKRRRSGNNDVCSALELRTFHGAKGLEYDRVILIDLTDKVMPSQRGLSQARGDDTANPNVGAMELYLEEERRLLYVAMTRAKRQLEIHYPAFERTPTNLPPHPVEVTELNQIKGNPLLLSGSRFALGVVAKLKLQIEWC